MRSLFLPAAVALFFAGEPLMAETIDMHVDGVAYAVELFENDAAKAFARACLRPCSSRTTAGQNASLI